MTEALLIDGGLDRITARFRNATKALHDRLLGIITDEVGQVETLARLRLAELFPNASRMQAALSTSVEDGGTVINGTVTASGLPYLRIHEYGGRTSPHDIFPVNARALNFFSDHAALFRAAATAGTQEVFAKSVHHPGSQMPERSYLRYALQQRRSAIRSAFADAAMKAFE